MSSGATAPTARRRRPSANPRRLGLPDGSDPADVLRIGGATGLAGSLKRTISVAKVLIDRRIDERLAVDSDAFARVDLCRDLTPIIGALPPEEWLALSQELSDRLDLSLVIVHEEVIDAGIRWTDEPQARVTRELARLAASAAPKLAIRAPEVGPVASLSCAHEDIARIPSPMIER